LHFIEGDMAKYAYHKTEEDAPRVGVFIWHAFGNGVPVILVSGCHIGDCHYINANHWTEKRVIKMKNKMEKVGIRPERLQIEWVSAAEGMRFSEVMHKIEAVRKTVTQEEIDETMRIVSEIGKGNKETL
jgi:heterodisulfide reductase subunit A2